MANKKADEQMISELFSVITSLESEEDCRKLFSDLCTNKEIEQMAQRIKAAKLLSQGKTYEQVKAECDISSATLSRVSHCVKYGEGYSLFFK